MMKKFLFAIFFVLAISSVSFGANSSDIFLRQNVLDENVVVLSERINAIDTRISDLRQSRYLYLFLMILLLFVAFSSIIEFFKWREDRKEARNQSFTLEDVKLLIAEAIAQAQLK